MMQREGQQSPMFEESKGVAAGNETTSGTTTNPFRILNKKDKES